MAGKVRTVSYVVTSLLAAAWTKKAAKFVPNEDIYLIGMCGGVCQSSEGATEFRSTKGVSDPAVDLQYEDMYFHTLHMTGAGGAGSGGGLSGAAVFLPPGYFFKVDEDEPIFIDMYARAIGDGGTVTLYYINKRDWKK